MSRALRAAAWMRMRAVLGVGLGLGRLVARWRFEMPSVERQEMGEEGWICQAEGMFG